MNDLIEVKRNMFIITKLLTKAIYIEKEPDVWYFDIINGTGLSISTYKYPLEHEHQYKLMEYYE